MKLKKALSGILAAAMVVTLTPAMAFASTTNVVSNVQTFAKTDGITASVELKITNATASSAWTNTAHDVTLKLDNAKWATKGGVDASSKLTTTTAALVVVPSVLDKDGVLKPNASVTVKYLSSDSITLNIPVNGYGGSNSNLITGDIIKLDLVISTKSSSSDEDVTVSISDDNGAISSGTYTLGTVVGGKTTAKVSDYGTEDLASLIVRSKDQATSDITIKEVTTGCLGSSELQEITLTLPSEITWSDNFSAANVTGTMVDSSSGITVARDPSNARKMTIKFNTAVANSTRRTLTIAPIVDTSKNAAEGEVSVTLRKVTGNITEASDLVIGEVGETAIKVYVDEEDYKDNKLPSIYSGIVYNDQGAATDIKKAAVITLEETGNKDFTADKWVDFTFDKAVQISGSVLYKIDGGTSTDTGLENGTVTYDKNRNSFGWQVPNTLSGTSKQKIKFYIPITVEAGFEGDIDCKVTGDAAGVAETTVTVATAKPVISVASEVSEVRTGIQNQAIKDIVITEVESGALSDTFDKSGMLSGVGGSGIYKGTAGDYAYDAYTESSSELVVEFPFDLKELPTVKATVGDIDLDDVDWITSGRKDAIKIGIKADSVKEASEITISDIKISLSRTPAEGGYDIYVYGTAAVQNAGFAKEQAFADAYTLENIINVVTPADSTTVSEKVQAEFVIGEASYTNNGAATEMDAAPYIDSHNRTMVPIRYVANACGISENDIRWDQNTQTAIINGLNTVVTVKMGSNKLQTSTGEITMDTAAVNNNGRIYVPVRYIANALGANVSWDAATKTVTLTK